MAAGTLTLPVVGQVPRPAVYVAVAATAGIVGYAWWKRGQGATDATPAVDPTATGDNADPGYTNPAPGSPAPSSTATDAPTTDPQWSDLVLQRMTWYEPGYLSGILGKYLDRQPLALAEANVIREAWAAAGKPPGNQPIIRSQAPGGGPVTATPKAPTGLKATRVDRNGVALDWSPATGANGYKVFVNGKQSGNAVVYSNAYVDLPKPNTSYRITVAGIFTGDKTGPQSGAITVKTKK
jgi:hypothetical protein